jgi:hypothetical protein
MPRRNKVSFFGYAYDGLANRQTTLSERCAVVRIALPLAGSAQWAGMDGATLGFVVCGSALREIASFDGSPRVSFVMYVLLAKIPRPCRARLGLTELRGIRGFVFTRDMRGVVAIKPSATIGREVRLGNFCSGEMHFF